MAAALAQGGAAGLAAVGVEPMTPQRLADIYRGICIGLGIAIVVSALVLVMVLG